MDWIELLNNFEAFRKKNHSEKIVGFLYNLNFNSVYSKNIFTHTLLLLWQNSEELWTK